MSEFIRIPKSEGFMKMAFVASESSTCIRRQIGAVAVIGNRVVATGFNGAPPGCEHCCDIKVCLRQKLNIPSGERDELCRALHAEQNLIISAASMGISLHGASIYCTHKPCIVCLKMLIGIGVKKVYFVNDYPSHLVEQFLDDPGVGIELIQVPNPLEK